MTSNTDQAGTSQRENGERPDVFISYSRRDEWFADALQRELAKVVPPDRRDTGLPLRVLRDRTDAAGTDYARAILNQVQRARKLLVICSAYSVDSPYVAEEIETFSEVHSTSDIVTALAPSSDQDKRHFPPALLVVQPRPLAADFRRFRRQGSLIRKPLDGEWFKLLSDILDLPRELVEERERARLRRRSLEVGLTTTLAAAVLVAIGNFLWQSTDYYQLRFAEERAEQLASKPRFEGPSSAAGYAAWAIVQAMRGEPDAVVKAIEDADPLSGPVEGLLTSARVAASAGREEAFTHLMREAEARASYTLQREEVVRAFADTGRTDAARRAIMAMATSTEGETESGAYVNGLLDLALSVGAASTLIDHGGPGVLVAAMHRTADGDERTSLAIPAAQRALREFNSDTDDAVLVRAYDACARHHLAEDCSPFARYVDLTDQYADGYDQLIRSVVAVGASDLAHELASTRSKLLESEEPYLIELEAHCSSGSCTAQRERILDLDERLRSAVVSPWRLPLLVASLAAIGEPEKAQYWAKALEARSHVGGVAPDAGDLFRSARAFALAQLPADAIRVLNEAFDRGGPRSVTSDSLVDYAALVRSLVRARLLAEATRVVEALCAMGNLTVPLAVAREVTPNDPAAVSIRVAASVQRAFFVPSYESVTPSFEEMARTVQSLGATDALTSGLLRASESASDPSFLSRAVRMLHALGRSDAASQVAMRNLNVALATENAIAGSRSESIHDALLLLEDAGVPDGPEQTLRFAPGIPDAEWTADLALRLADVGWRHSATVLVDRAVAEVQRAGDAGADASLVCALAVLGRLKAARQMAETIDDSEKLHAYSAVVVAAGAGSNDALRRLAETAVCGASLR